mgnify:CR=1 FL=1
MGIQPRRLRTSRRKQMGRPLNKRYFGAPTAGGNEIKVQFNDGTGSMPGYIVKQKASKRFECSNAGGTKTDICLLVDKASASLLAGEMSIVVDDNGTARQVTKISGRKVTMDNGIMQPWDFTGAGDGVAIEEAGTGVGVGVDGIAGTDDDVLTGAYDTEGDG